MTSGRCRAACAAGNAAVPGPAGLNPAGIRVAIVFDRAAQSALADLHFAILSCVLPALECGHAHLERDVNDPPE